MTTRPGISPTDWITLARYVSGEARPDERASLDARAAADPAFAQLMSESLVGWTVAGVTPLQRDKQAAWTAIEARSSRAAGHPNGPPRLRFKTRPLRQKMWSATVALVLTLVVFGAGWTIARSHTSRPSASMLAYVTGNGERATIKLPDGGTVALNVASRLEVPLDYMTGNHAVRLVGEGLFTVPHRTGTPLTVVAGQTTARVLGTSFVVRRYPTDTTALVAVREGKVAVSSTIVTANQMVEVGRSGRLNVRPSDAAAFTFATGILTLHSLPLPSAAVELGRWYDADIRLEDPALATEHVDGEFAAGSLVDLQALLEGTLNVRVVRDGRVLTLYSR